MAAEGTLPAGKGEGEMGQRQVRGGVGKEREERGKGSKRHRRLASTQLSLLAAVQVTVRVSSQRKHMHRR